jgi:serine phosphatase RsbU (regulator of sigma subunit)
VAVGYQPASRSAQVGGDWHDAFGRPDGVTTVVVGDVAGHDQDAAAAMAQVRNVLRGVAQVLPVSPADVVAGLDAALAELQLGVLATLALGQLSPAPGRPGQWRLRWCNAGHPPPLLVRADGTTALPAREPDLLVGLLREVPRADHEVLLHPGDTVLLYTDGLVETRRGDIEADLERLQRRVAADGAPDPQALVDGLLAGAGVLDDDVALLAVQVERT